MTLRALFTAAASGSGLGVARAFVSSGARVFIGDIETAVPKNAVAAEPGVERSFAEKLPGASWSSSLAANLPGLMR